MLAIVNVSTDDAPNIGLNQYEVRVNSKVIATFEHHRQLDGAAQCLRDAADAIEASREKERLEMLKALHVKIHEEQDYGTR